VEQPVGTTVDDQVLADARSGCEKAWQTLVDAYISLVHGITRSYGLKRKASAEVNQVVWLRLVEHLPRIRHADAVSGWIAATTRAECLKPRWASRRISWAATTIRGDEARLFAAFLRIGVRCQRLLRLVAIAPRPSDEDVSAALDLEAKAVEPQCERCLDRLSRLLQSDQELLLKELQKIVAYGDNVPDGWRRQAANARRWLLIDAPVAERVYDSTTPGGLQEPAVSSIATEVRQMRFLAGTDGVDLALDTKDGEVMLSGHVVPARAAAVTARWPNGAQVGRSDETGTFRFHGLPLAPISVQVDGSSPLKTGWVVP